MDRTKKAWINIAFLIITLGVNTLGALGLINGLTQKQVSDMYITLITPSPVAFGIWIVIYSLLIISMIVMIVKKDDTYYQKAIDSISYLFIISCIFNIGWIILFSFVLVETSVIFILGLTVTLAIIDIKLLEICKANRWLLKLSFGLYSGWLFIAAVVNIAAALVKNDWNGFGLSQETWGCIILIIAIILLIGVLLKIRNAVFPIPAAWAYFGIYLNLQSFATLQIISLLGMCVLIVFSLVQFWRNHFCLNIKSVCNFNKR